MQKFVNRAKELDALEKQYHSNESSLVIVYGRRRVGKTALIAEFLKRHSDSLYFLATEESEMQNLNYFKTQVTEFTGNELLKSAAVDWFTVFKTLVEYKTETKKIIVFDEFQYIGQSNSAFPSVMQKVWDTLLKDANVMLILCGSLVSLMKSQTLDYSSPLYGRRTAQIKLKQIPFSHYHEFFEGRENNELLPFYAVTGGVPKYIETFCNYTDIFEAIEENVLNSQSFLYEEPYFLLQKEVSEIGSYFSLIKAIAMGNRKLSDIATNLGLKQTGLTKYLKVLMDLDLVEREVPITETAPEKSKSGLYRIADNFIAFWFKFVYPYRAYRSFCHRSKKVLRRTMRLLSMRTSAVKKCGSFPPRIHGTSTLIKSAGIGERRLVKSTSSALIPRTEISCLANVNTPPRPKGYPFCTLCRKNPKPCSNSRRRKTYSIFFSVRQAIRRG